MIKNIGSSSISISPERIKELKQKSKLYAQQLNNTDGNVHQVKPVREEPVKTYSPEEIEEMKRKAEIYKKQLKDKEISERSWGDAFNRQTLRGVNLLSSIPAEIASIVPSVLNPLIAGTEKGINYEIDELRRKVQEDQRAYPNRYPKVEPNAIPYEGQKADLGRLPDEYGKKWRQEFNERFGGKLGAETPVEEVIDRAGPYALASFMPSTATKAIGKAAPVVGKALERLTMPITSQNVKRVLGGVAGAESYRALSDEPGPVGDLASYIAGSSIAGNPLKAAQLVGKGASKVGTALINPVDTGHEVAKWAADKYQNARQKTEDFIAKHYGEKMGINEDQIETLNAWGIPISMPLVAENKQYATSMVDNALRTERGSQPIKNYFQDVEDIGATHFIGNPDRSRDPLYAADIPLAAKQATSNLRAEYKKKIAPAEGLINILTSQGVSHKGQLNLDLFDYFGNKVDFSKPKNTQKEYNLMLNSPIYQQIDRVKQSENKLLFKKIEQDKSGVTSIVYDIKKIPNEKRRLKAREALIDKVGKEKVEAAENLIKNYEGKAELGVIESAMEKLAIIAKDNTLTPTERSQASRTRKNLKDMIDEQGKIYNPEQNKILRDAKKFYMEENTQQLSDGSYQTYSNKPGLIKRSEKFWDSDSPFTTLMSNLDDNLPVIIKSKNKELNKRIAQDIFTELGWRGGQFSLTKLAASMKELTPTVKKNLLKMQNFTHDQQKNFYKLMDIMSENAETLRLVANASGSGHKVQATLTKLDKLKGTQKGVTALNNQEYFKAASYVLSPFILPYYNKKMAELMVSPSYVNNVQRVIKKTTDFKKNPNKTPSQVDLRDLQNLAENSVSKELLKMADKKKDKPIIIRPSDAKE
jgi:hypothetical protein